MKRSRTSVPSEVAQVADLIGNFIEYWGFKKVHGRIWTCLFLSARPLDAAELMARLRISKALVSISLRDLAKYDVIVDGPRSAARTRTYRANPEVMNVIIGVLRRREKRLLERVRDAAGALNAQTPGLSEERVRALQSMSSRAVEALEGLLALRELSMACWGEFNLDQ